MHSIRYHAIFTMELATIFHQTSSALQILITKTAKQQMVLTFLKYQKMRYSCKLTPVVVEWSELLPRRPLRLDEAFPDEDTGMHNATLEPLCRATAPRVARPHLLTHLLDDRQQLSVLRHAVVFVLPQWRRRRHRDGRYSRVTIPAMRNVLVDAFSAHGDRCDGDVTQLRLYGLDIHRLHCKLLKIGKERVREIGTRLIPCGGTETYLATCKRLNKLLKTTHASS